MADSDLPHDLLLLILIRLPIKSLLRFKFVSKSWNLLISTQDFAKMHLNHSLIHLRPLRLVWKDEIMVTERISRMHIFAVDCSKLEDSANTIHRLHHPLEFPERILSILIGSCNGLLCVISPCPSGSVYEESFFVFNPLIRKGSAFYGKRCNRFGRSYYYGFGYDDVNDDYKVVTWGVRPERGGDDSDCSKFDVYSMKEGSWRTRISGLTGFYIENISCGVLVNSTLHWIWMNGDDMYNINIVAFDLRTEQHMLLETPENYLAIPYFDNENEVYHCKFGLGALNGCLCVIHFAVQLDLWVMKDYRLKDSWTKMTINMSIGKQFTRWLRSKPGIVTIRPVVPIVHVEDKKEMILYNYEKGFSVCDMVTNKLLKVIKIPEFDPRRRDRLPRTYSFVSKEFCFQSSLVQPLGFDSFDSLWDE